ncbi:MAG: oligosaccharide flippase family protein, partial [Clostridia bacterium]|nr:oligosaccharide flippase family protein [Clostridia bacterium]
MAVKSKDTFVKGAAILGIAGLICKIIGAFYRIALFNILSAPGMAFYEMAYPIYSFLLVLSTAGLPTAISKLVSEKVAVDDYRAAHRTFQSAYKTLFYIGVITMALMFLGAPIYANLYNLKDGVHSLRAIAPALFFVSIVAAYRGYFQGMQIMTPTALSQLIEQAGKLIVGFAFASYFFKYGAQYGAMGALLGVSISEFLAMVLLIIMYNMHKGEIHRNMREHRATVKEPAGKIIRRLV